METRKLKISICTEDGELLDTQIVTAPIHVQFIGIKTLVDAESDPFADVVMNVGQFKTPLPAS